MSEEFIRHSHDAHLVAFLDMVVPLEILDLQAHGGPSAADWEVSRTTAAAIAEKADLLLFGGRECASLAGRLARSIAVGAFVPGGIRMFGRTWSAPP